VGVADLVTEKADVYHDDQSGSSRRWRSRRDPGRARTWRDTLVEMVAESNEDLIETFFEKGTLAQEDLVRGLRKAVLQGRLFPCSRLVPAQRRRPPLLDAIVDLLPSPTDRGEAAGPIPRPGSDAAASPDGTLSAYVFKTIADPHAGRISLFRVYSGTMKSTRASTTPRATWPSAWVPWSCCRARPRRRCPRFRRATWAPWPS
jgi:elongation factor G